jgi:hypothetical protein
MKRSMKSGTGRAVFLDARMPRVPVRDTKLSAEVGERNDELFGDSTAWAGKLHNFIGAKLAGLTPQQQQDVARKIRDALDDDPEGFGATDDDDGDEYHQDQPHAAGGMGKGPAGSLATQPRRETADGHYRRNLIQDSRVGVITSIAEINEANRNTDWAKLKQSSASARDKLNPIAKMNAANKAFHASQPPAAVLGPKHGKGS